MNGNSIEGKKILLIALPGYSQGIIKQMRKMGAVVDHVNDKPNEGFWCKTLGRLQIRFYQKVLNRYYNRRIEELKDNNYDYVLVLRGEYTPVNSLIKLRECFCGAKFVLYIWDGLHKRNTYGIEKKWEYFDSVFTFDRIDYEENKKSIRFLPLYYYNEYLPKDGDRKEEPQYQYDISFIGTGHSDRVKIVRDVIEQCQRAGLKTFQYIFIPHLLVFYKNKIFNKDFKGVRKKDMQFKMLPFEKLYDVYSKSKCVVDVEDPGQHGLTMRTIEVIGLRKKLITTNTDIINYDFYNPNNILVIDRKKPIVDMAFFDKTYEELAPEIYEKYSLEKWIIAVLG